MHAPTPFHLLAFATSFAMVGICTGLALGAGANPLTVVTLRTVGTVLLFIAYFRMVGVGLRLAPRERLIAFALGLPRRASGWAGVLGVPFFYAFAMIGLFWASARLGAVRTGFFMNFEPIAAILLAALILDQVLAPVQLAGAALVIAALYLFRAGGASRSSGASLSRRS